MFNLNDWLERPYKAGTTLNKRYKILHFIGKGSYGMVYRATDPLTGNIVVIKQARNRKKKEREGYLQREAEMLAALSHSRIPTCLDFFEERDRAFLVMEWKPGKNIEDLIFQDGQQFNEEDSLQLLVKVLKIVHYLHEHEVIHRDLRIPNILIDKEDVSIIDLGLATRLDHVNDLEILPSMPLEKQLYREISVTSDFYALGHFLLFLLYSTYKPSSRKELSWEEELSIHPRTKMLVRKLLKLDNPFQDINEIIKEVNFITSLLKACV
ncbi:serine/threonine protein kinase [Bacillus sp. AK128]